jgi:predicted dehydrogenase
MSEAQQKLSFGICGLGFMGRTHFGHLRKHALARVVAVCDADPDLRTGNWSRSTGNIDPRCAERADLAGVAAYATPDELIRDPAVEVVLIALPTPLHVEVTEAALAAGKHVFCEKPMALDVPGCERMIRAAEQTGRTLMVGQCIRFWPQYETIRRYVDEGRVGPVRFVKLKRVASPPRYSNQDWLMQGRQSGGASLDLHVHDVDFVQRLLGVPDTVSARGGRGPSGEIDHVFALYGYADGRYALLEGGWTYHTPRPFEMAITVCGQTGTLEWSSLQGRDVLFYNSSAAVQRIECVDQTGWLRELDYFIDCVLTGRPVQRCLPSSSATSVALALIETHAIRVPRPLWPASD